MTKKREDDLRHHEMCDLLLAIQRVVDSYEPDFNSLMLVLGSFVTDAMEQLENSQPGWGYEWRDVFVNLLNQIDITDYESEESES